MITAVPPWAKSRRHGAPHINNAHTEGSTQLTAPWNAIYYTVCVIALLIMYSSEKIKKNPRDYFVSSINDMAQYMIRLNTQWLYLHNEVSKRGVEGGFVALI